MDEYSACKKRARDAYKKMPDGRQRMTFPQFLEWLCDAFDPHTNSAKMIINGQEIPYRQWFWWGCDNTKRCLVYIFRDMHDPDAAQFTFNIRDHMKLSNGIDYLYMAYSERMIHCTIERDNTVIYTIDIYPDNVMPEPNKTLPVFDRVRDGIGD